MSGHNSNAYQRPVFKPTASDVSTFVTKGLRLSPDTFQVESARDEFRVTVPGEKIKDIYQGLAQMTQSREPVPGLGVSIKGASRYPSGAAGFEAGGVRVKFVPASRSSSLQMS